MGAWFLVFETARLRLSRAYYICLSNGLSTFEAPARYATIDMHRHVPKVKDITPPSQAQILAWFSSGFLHRTFAVLERHFAAVSSFRYCNQKHIPLSHPRRIGWGFLCRLVDDYASLSSILSVPEHFYRSRNLTNAV